jgi:hypothetical protein
MAKILVVCYSRTGITEGVARDVAKALGADFDRIEDTSSRKGVLGFARSVFESLARGVPAIRTHQDPARYELVVLATPCWASSISSPMRAYVLLHRAALRKVAAIVTMGGYGGDQAQSDLFALCGVDSAPSCVCNEREIKTNAHQARLTGLVTQIKQLVGEPVRSSAVL